MSQPPEFAPHVRALMEVLLARGMMAPVAIGVVAAALATLIANQEIGRLQGDIALAAVMATLPRLLSEARQGVAAARAGAALDAIVAAQEQAASPSRPAPAQAREREQQCRGPNWNGA